MSQKWDFNSINPTPPFENPNIATVCWKLILFWVVITISFLIFLSTQIIRTFISVKFGALQEVHRHNMEKIGGFYVSIINRAGMIGPVIESIPAPLAEKYKFWIDHLLWCCSWYLLYLIRWKQYCNPQDPNCPKLRPCDVFGKLMFRLLYRVLSYFIF